MSAHPEFTNLGQPSNLRPVKRVLTTHDSTGQTKIHSAEPCTWQRYQGDAVGFNYLYSTTEFPVTFTNETDIEAFNTLKSNDKLDLTQPNGTVVLMVEFAPGFLSSMHRTQSLDYGVVIEGDVELKLDSGEVQSLKKGDVVVQRGTNHAWRNTSETEWARMLFVLQHSNAVEVGDKKLERFMEIPLERSS